MRTRPAELFGSTFKIKTASGNLYITVNVDADGLITEIFSTIGKTGTENRALLDALCRLSSVGLQRCHTLDETKDYIKEIIHQFSGIVGEAFTFGEGGGVGRAQSVPDAIAHVLKDKIPEMGGHYRLYSEPEAIPESSTA